MTHSLGYLFAPKNSKLDQLYTTTLYGLFNGCLFFFFGAKIFYSFQQKISAKKVQTINQSL